MKNFNFNGDVLLEVRKALKMFCLKEYLRYLSQDDLLKIYNYYLSKEQFGDNKYIKESAEFLIMDKKSLIRK